jgi:hypothetical protein
LTAPKDPWFLPQITFETGESLMSFAKLFWMVGGAGVVVAVSAVGVVACSSSSSPTTPAADGGGTTTADTGTGDGNTGVVSDAGTDTGTTGNDSGGSEDSGGGSCEKPPTLHPETAPGVYCPFSGVDGGDDITCTAGQHCCETPESSNAASTCQPIGTPCPVANSIDWECEEAIDCTAVDAGDGGGPICCGTGTPTTETACGVTWPEWTAFTGTKCAASCPSPGITVCETQADCTGSDGGCTASKAEGNQFGFCGAP